MGCCHTASSLDKRKRVESLGADLVVGYEDFPSAVAGLSDNVGIDVVYDPVGKATFEGSLECLNEHGYPVLFGQSSGAVHPFDLQRLCDRSLFITRPKLWSYLRSRDEVISRADEMLQWTKRGKWTVHIDSQYPLIDAPMAHRRLASRQSSGKVVLTL